MADKLLDVNGLTVSVEEKEILHNINLSINKGETHVLMGPNGAGKSTLGFALMGNPKYTLNSGGILFDGKNIKEETPDKRSKDGIFLCSKVLLRFRDFHFHRSFVTLLKRTVAKESAFGTLKKSSERQWSFYRWIRPIPSVI